MHHRILPWLFLCAIFAAVSLRGQTPTVKGGREEIRVAKVKGEVTMITVDGTTSKLKERDNVPQKAKIITAKNNASVVLVFSNGATTLLEADTELVVEEFLVDPFDTNTTLETAKADKEPSASVTKLALNRGELVGDVKKLDYNRGSSFKVQTPVGAAGIRGTIFRIVFRPGGTGMAFFTLSTATGNVAFDQGGTGGGGTASPNNPGSTLSASGNVVGLSIPQGQEIAIEVSVTTNAQGQMVVTVLPPPPTSTTSIPSSTLQTVTTAASDIAVAVQGVTFPPAPPTPNAPQTTTVTGQNFTADVTETPAPPPPPPPRIITTNPNP